MINRMNNSRSVRLTICQLHNHFVYALLNYWNVSSVLPARPDIRNKIFQ